VAPIKVQASGGTAAQWENLWSVDYSAVSSATWTAAGGPYSVTAASGSVGGAVDHVVRDGLNSLHGPDGAKGIAQTSTSGSLKYYNSDDAPELVIDVADLLGGAVSADDVLAFTVTADGELPNANWEAWGLAVVDTNNDGFQSRAIWLSSAEQIRFGRVVASAAATTSVAQSGVRLLQIILYPGESARFGYETSNTALTVGTMATQIDATKDYGNIESRVAGSTVKRLDFANMRLVLFSESQNSASYPHIFKGLQVWRGVP